jgi:hypothetical protein
MYRRSRPSTASRPIPLDPVPAQANDRQPSFASGHAALTPCVAVLNIDDLHWVAATAWQSIITPLPPHDATQAYRTHVEIRPHTNDVLHQLTRAGKRRSGQQKLSPPSFLCAALFTRLFRVSVSAESTIAVHAAVCDPPTRGRRGALCRHAGKRVRRAYRRPARAIAGASRSMFWWKRAHGRSM